MNISVNFLSFVICAFTWYYSYVLTFILGENLECLFKLQKWVFTLLTRHLWKQKWENKCLLGLQWGSVHICGVLDLDSGGFTYDLSGKSSVVKTKDGQRLWANILRRQVSRMPSWWTFCPLHGFCDWTCLNSIIKHEVMYVKCLAKCLLWSNDSVVNKIHMNLLKKKKKTPLSLPRKFYFGSWG